MDLWTCGGNIKIDCEDKVIYERNKQPKITDCEDCYLKF